MNLTQVLCVLSRLCEFVHASALLCLESTVPLESFTTSVSHNLLPPCRMDPRVIGTVESDEGISFRTESSKLGLCTLSSCGPLS